MFYNMLFFKVTNLTRPSCNVFRNFSHQSPKSDVIFNYLQGRYEGVAVIVLIIFPGEQEKSLLEEGANSSFAKKSFFQAFQMLSFNRPEQKNAFSMNLVKELNRYVEKVNFDNVTKVVILKSMTPKIFCAGADLKERAVMSEIQVAEFVTNLRGLMNKVQNISVPVLAAIDGIALGGGLEIALACDIRVASVDAKMGLVETKLAIIPGAGGTQRLPRIINPSIAKELIYTSKIINGTTAYELGLVNHVVDQDEKGEGAYHKCLSIAEDILPNGPFAIQMAKQAISRGLEVDLYSGLSIEEACYAQIIPTKDRIEGLTAFKEKRKPKYQGV